MGNAGQASSRMIGLDISNKVCRDALGYDDAAGAAAGDADSRVGQGGKSSAVYVAGQVGVLFSDDRHAQPGGSAADFINNNAAELYKVIRGKNVSYKRQTGF